MKLFLLTICIALLLINLSIQGQVKKEGDVYILNKDNFDNFIVDNEFVLVKFYATWCSHCKAMAPEYAKAATVLQNDEKPIILAKVDATEEKDLAQKFAVEGFPTLKFFMNGNPIEYTGGRTDEEIINWCRRKTGPSLVEVNSQEELDKITQDNEVVVIFFGSKANNPAQFQAFDQASRQYDEVIFVFTNNKNLISQNSVQNTPQIIVLKQFDEKRAEMNSEINLENLHQFINVHQFPNVMHFNQKTAERIFGENQPTLFLFVDNNNPSLQASQEFLKASESLKGKLLLSSANIEESFGERLAEFLAVLKGELPTMRLIQPTEIEVKKYFFQGAVNEKSILKYVEDFQNGKLKAFFKSQPIPEHNDEPVKVIVADNWKDIALNEQNDVLVMFYAPWCSHCKAVTPILDQVATKLLQTNPNIVIAKCDATENEIEGVAIEGFPTIKFWSAKNKQQPVDFEGERTEQGILQFLKDKTSQKWNDNFPKQEEL